MAELRLIFLSFILYSIVCVTLIECRDVRGSGCGSGSGQTKQADHIQKQKGDFSSDVGIESTDGLVTCGGTLIAPKTVLTSASCLMYTNKTALNCGEIKVYGPTDKVTARKTEEKKGRSCHSHSSYGKSHRVALEIPKNDIGIIILDSAFTETDSFKPLRVSEAAPAAGTQCEIAILARIIGNAGSGTGGGDGGGDVTTTPAPAEGADARTVPARLAEISDEDWDQSSTDNEGFSTDLHSYDYLSRNLDNRTTIKTVNVISSEECFKGAEGEASNNTFCGKADQCLRYHGAGLICNKTLAGIITKPCATSDLDFYTNVAAYKDWIDENSGGSIPSVFAMSSLIAVFFGMTRVSKILYN